MTNISSVSFSDAIDVVIRGRIIAISSVCAMECEPGQSAYDSGKRGMDGVLRVLAKEIGRHNITVVRHLVNFATVSNTSI